jgi:hypothetical protein
LEGVKGAIVRGTVWEPEGPCKETDSGCKLVWETNGEGAMSSNTEISEHGSWSGAEGRWGTDSTMAGELVDGEIEEIRDCLTYFII